MRAFDKRSASKEEVRADIEKRVKQILAGKGPLTRSVEIYHDLHIAGDDAVQLIEGIKNCLWHVISGFRIFRLFSRRD